MKKIRTLLFVGLLVLSGCSAKKSDDQTIKIIATAVPHAEILEEAKPILKENYGIDLDIEITDDYYFPNKAVDAGDADANYFQHVPFFDGEIEKYGYKLTNAGGIHIEPIGIYSKKYTDVSQIEDGATVIISNSIADHGRILNVFAAAGLITLKEGVDATSATLDDIVDNPKNLNFKAEVAPELLVQAYQGNEADLVAINSNYALNAGLNPVNDSLIIESTKDNPYVNIVAVQEGHENDEKIKALIEVLKSDAIKQFISEKYNGSVIVAE